MTIGVGKTILLVEDNALVGMTSSMDLKAYGYKVVHALNGRKALEVMNDDKISIDAVLMDINLGPHEQDGTEVAEKILKDHDIPILFLSSHTEKDVVAKTEKITSFGYVVKNSGITVLDRSIKMALRLHEAYQDLIQQSDEIFASKRELESYGKRYRRLFESAKDGILILDADTGRIVDANPFLLRMLGYSKEQILKKVIWEISAFKNIAYSKQLFKKLQDKEYVRYDDLPLETRDGIEIHVEFVSNVYYVDNEKVIQCNIRDITNRMKHEKELTVEIGKKEALFKELQHRTKNSFNMITSLIRLRSAVAPLEDTKKALEELNIRVKSISDLYSLLYDTDSFFEVRIDDYCRKVIESMLNLAKNIKINSRIEAITVSTGKATTLGMILVELISNSIKHAFPESQDGIIDIELEKIDSKFVLKFADNGVGLKKGFDLAEIQDTGFRLVNAMVQQLEGNIKLSSEKGTKIIIEFTL